MKVVFVSENGRTHAVLWQKGPGLVMSRVMFEDGKTEDQVCDSDTLRAATREWSGSYSAVHVAEVDDLRSAFKYLGKASDLAETLPEVSANDTSTLASPAS